jgi:hypothetical protein
MDAILQKLIDKVLHMDDIIVEDVSVLSGVLDALLDTASSLGLAASQYSAVHLRGKQLHHILNAKSAEIADEWVKGSLFRAGWSKQQIIALVKAIFGDNSNRDACLQRIHEVSFT